MRTVIVFTLLCCICHVDSYGFFRAEIPNGNSVPHPCKEDAPWPGVGHLNVGGGGARNQFGIDFHNNNKTWTRKLCMMDSDGDGMTNGKELGDPNCEWTKGAPQPRATGDITHPGVCDPFYSPQCQDKNRWVDCTKEEFVCPAISQPDVQNLTMSFPKTQVPDKETTYMCMIFDLPTDKDYHMIAYKPEIDNDNVMHHIIVYGCGERQANTPNKPYACNMGAGYNCEFNTIGLWTLGQSGTCLSEQFGMLFGKTKYKSFALEFHWNNPGYEKNWFDASGMTIFYTSKLRPNNGAVMTLGENYLEIPPGKPSVSFRSTCSSDCTKHALTAPLYVAGALNHMHYLGHSMFVEHKRNGQTVQYITNETTYSYDNPLYNRYDPPLEIRPRDEFVTTCRFKSTYRKKWTYYGSGTSDEMCFALLWFYPAESMPETYCITYKSVPLCAARTRPNIIGGCNVFYFLSWMDPGYIEIDRKLTENCNLYGRCDEQCKFAILEAKQHPCLRGGDVTGYLESVWHKSKKGLEFLRRLDMCDVKPGDVKFPVGSPGIRVGSSAYFALLAVLSIVIF